MKNLLIAMMLFAPALCFSADRFRLESELLTNFTGSDTTARFLTGYTYDGSGNRVQSRVWSGTDSTAAAMSGVKLTYDINGNLTQELLLSGADTLSIVRYVYGGGRRIAVKTLDKTGTLRFTDSLIYNGQGVEIEEQRISSAGARTFFHRYSFNGLGKKVADSLYELVSAAYVATQAVVFSYNPDSTVATEASWRLSGASWYCISTAFMKYASGALVSVALHDRDGAGTAMTDSLAYVNDTYGNRTRAEAYDGDKVLLRTIVYSWRDMQPVYTLMGTAAQVNRQPVLSNSRGGLTVSLLPHERGEISLFTMTGRQLCRLAVDHSGAVPLDGLVGKGSYVAVFTSSVNKQIMNYSTIN